ncbi:MAG: M3 family oligoendopeptidase [Candidatus Binatia bacterium]
MSWDLTSYFPEFNGPEMLAFKDALGREIDLLRGRAGSLSGLASETEGDWEGVLISYEDLQRRLSHLSSYVGCLAAADSRNEGYLKESSSLARVRAEFSKVRVELLRAVKECADECFARFVERPALKGARHYLVRLREEARRSMSREKENLAADLAVDGIQAWGRLYDTLSGKLEFDMVFPDGRRERLPISQRRSLMEHPDRRVRRGAFEGGNAAWSKVEDTAAAALNAIAGTRLTLNRHRGVEHFLDVALFQSAITKKTLDAMLSAVFANLDLPRRIVRLKAQLMQRNAIAWYDLGAPLGLSEQDALDWESAKALVKHAFTLAYPRLGEFFQDLVQRKWVDWEPRPGKRPGGFCTSSALINESRIFMTYNDSLGDVLTLAHESGHAFQSQVMRDLRPFARSFPMTLAETASTFGELILLEGLLDDPSVSDAQRALMLDTEIGHGAVYLLDIPVRYEFEKAFYEERGGGELTVSRLKEIMTETQRRILADVLEEGGEDPLFWASKLHFYIPGTTFYNFPYTFGFLLSRGLYSTFKKEGAGFLPRYEEFLRLAGSDSAENVARRTIGRDLESFEFWAEAIRSLDEPLNRLEELLPKIRLRLSI